MKGPAPGKPPRKIASFLIDLPGLAYGPLDAGTHEPPGSGQYGTQKLDGGIPPGGPAKCFPVADCRIDFGFKFSP